MSYTKKKRFPYTKEVLNKALDAIKSGATINSASKKYKIPRSTLHSKLTNKYNKDKPGRYTVLSVQEEENLAKWVRFMCTLGRAVTKDHVINSVALLVKTWKKPNPFIDGRPGRNWYEGFLRRHQELRQKIRESVRLSRQTVNEKSVRKWFDQTKSCLKTVNLENIDSSRVFSVGETMLSMTSRKRKIVSESDSKSEGMVEDSGEKTHTVLVAGNAAGQLAPVMIVFDCEQISDNVYKKLPQGWSVRASEKGYMTADFFYEYIESYFYPWLVKNNVEFPVILYIDECAPYLTLRLSELFKQYQITIIILPPNITYFLQPLKVGIFSHLSARWKTHVHNYKWENGIKKMSEVDLGPLLLKTFESLDLVDILGKSFESCGLHPLTDELDYKKLCKSKMKQSEKMDVDEEDEALEIPETMSTTSNNQSLVLASIEKYIDPSTLEIFKSAVHNDEWTGKPEDTNLFYVWKKILNCTDCEDKTSKTQSEISDILTACVPVTNESKIHENQENLQPLDNLIGEYTLNAELPYQSLQYINRILNNEETNKVKVIVVHQNDFFLNNI